jgi:excinuclease ABC subunit A
VPSPDLVNTPMDAANAPKPRSLPAPKPVPAAKDAAGPVREPDFIEIRGAHEHNLRIDELRVPKRKLVVFTGVSGSGKSSLAFDTLYAEGQRRYIESLSAYARQFLGQLERPKVEHLRGLSPTIAIEQKSASNNPRSTVGTITEIYDYLRVLYARVGTQHCTECGKPVRSSSPEQIVEELLHEAKDARVTLLAPLVTHRKGEYRELFEELRGRGFVRVEVDGEVHRSRPHPSSTRSSSTPSPSSSTASSPASPTAAASPRASSSPCARATASCARRAVTLAA